MGTAADTIRAMYETLNRGDLADPAEYLHPEAEVHFDPVMPAADSYFGREEFMRGVRDWLDGWSEFRFEIEEMAEEDGFVVMRIQLRGRGKSSGLEAAQETHHVWTFRHGKPHRCVIRRDRQAALDEARRLL